jgi:phosphatidylglycerophosphate synthase
VKSDQSDELINTFFLRPIAGIIVWILYYTPITPNQVTIASILVGFIASFFYLQATPKTILIAGVLITVKDILDSADGQLARAKQKYSRVGRFLDSIGDFLVNVVVFGSIGYVLYSTTNNIWIIILAFLGLAGITFRVSYHVFYHVNYLHLSNKYDNNRITEEIRKEDIVSGGLELSLQRIFQLIYGWQDRLILKLDIWSRNSRSDEVSLHKWYSDRVGLFISGFLGIGTELFLLTICSVCNQLELYLFLNLFLMNGILLISIFYRRAILQAKLHKNAT